jgi:hypothetical protein
MTIARRRFSPLLCLGLIWGCVGCQTFSLSEEDYWRQQQGETVDPETGAVVGVAGTAAYYGAALGAALAGCFGR